MTGLFGDVKYVKRGVLGKPKNTLSPKPGAALGEQHQGREA